MSSFGNFSFGNQQPITTATTTTTTTTSAFGSVPAFGGVTNQQQSSMTKAFGSAPTTQPSIVFGSQSTTPSTSLFNLGTTTNPPQTQTNTTGLAFNFTSNTAAKPATTQQSTTNFGGLFASTNLPTTTNQQTTSTPSFNFNVSGISTTTVQSSTAPTLSLTTTASITQQANSSLLGNTTLISNQAQPQTVTSVGITQTTQSNILDSNKTSKFSLNFAGTQVSQSSTLNTTTSSQTSVTSSSVSTTATSTQSQQTAQMTFKQLEGYINVWLNELNQMESDFQKQSQTINSWDSLLVNNALKITNLNENLDLLKEDQKRVDQQLDFVISQQNELEQLLEPLEKIQQVDFNLNDIVTTEREFTYSLVDTVSNELQGIGTELQSFIKKLNEAKASQDINDPLSSISKILNSHMDALQFIEHQVRVLKRNVEA